MFGRILLSPQQVCSGSSLLQVLRSYHNAGQYALVKVCRADEQISFLVANGDLWPTCIVSGASCTVGATAQILHSDWTGTTLTQGPLSVFALRAAKICFSTSPPPEVKRLSAGDFYDLKNRYQQADQPGLLWARCADDEFFAFIPGAGKNIDQIANMAVGELVADPILVATVIETRCEEIQAAYFPFFADLEAWQEYRLHRYFCEMSEAVFRRYGELTGRVMVQALARSVNLFTANYSWPVEIRMGTVIDCLALPDLKQYRQTYQYILSHMLRQAAASVGNKLVGFMLADYVNSTQEKCRAEIVNLLPESYAFLAPVGESTHA